MDSNFSFLSTAHANFLDEVLNRRNPSLLERIRHTGAVSPPEAEEIMRTISDELTDYLDDDWEPTEHGLMISEVLARFNAARVAEWP